MEILVDHENKEIDKATKRIPDQVVCVLSQANMHL